MRYPSGKGEKGYVMVATVVEVVDEEAVDQELEKWRALEGELGGSFYRLQINLFLHCPLCPREETLTAGDICFVQERDSSSIFCTRHVPKPRPVVPVPQVPEQEPLWMAYE